MSYASAVDRLRGLIAGHLPPDLADATVVVGHPGILEDYAFGVTLYTVTLREDASRRLSQFPAVHETLVEAEILIAVHAPPERGLDGIRLLELVCRLVHQYPRFDGLPSDATATVVLRPTSVDELTGLWQALATPLQPAVLCTLRVLSTQVDDSPSAP